MPVEEFTSFVNPPQINVSLQPAHNVFYSMLLINKSEHSYGYNSWVQETLEKMTPQERHTHRLVMTGLFYATTPTQTWSSFNAFIDYLEALDPETLVDKLLDAYASLPLVGESCNTTDGKPAPYDKAVILSDAESFLGFLRTRFDEKYIDIELETEAYNFAIDPQSMQELIINHLKYMWEKYLAPEWQRVRPMLEDAVWAFRQIDFQGKSALEIAQMVTDQDLEGTFWEELLNNTDQVTFVPNIHTGPYLGKLVAGERTVIMFGARLPKGAHIYAPDLSRTEILVRLTALADDNRLRILKFIAQNGEQRSQDIMQALELSQSATSRHLKQLSATGYISERRCESAKCYRLNTERVDETLQAISAFLIGDAFGYFVPQIKPAITADNIY